MSSEAVFDRLDPRGAVLGDEVYAALGEAILDGRLRPGERLRDVDLAERLGVSRTPVREALQRLERSGLVEVSANRWTRVSVPDEALRAATHEFVVYAMGNAVRMAARRASDERLAELISGVDQMVAASEADDAAGLFGASARFFEDVTYATDNVSLQTVMEEAEFAIRRNLRGWRPYLTDPVLRTERYRAFRDAFAARRGTEAEAILRAQHGFGDEPDAVPADEGSRPEEPRR
jgi:DNA-binding GntR family transcriptional regulator